MSEEDNQPSDLSIKGQVADRAAGFVSKRGRLDCRPKLWEKLILITALGSLILNLN